MEELESPSSQLQGDEVERQIQKELDRLNFEVKLQQTLSGSNMAAELGRGLVRVSSISNLIGG